MLCTSILRTTIQNRCLEPVTCEERAISLIPLIKSSTAAHRLNAHLGNEILDNAELISTLLTSFSNRD